MPAHDSDGADRQALEEARLAVVEEHVRQENQHDLDGIMATFGATPEHEDTPLHDHHTGRDGVRTYYETLLRAVPDLHIDVERRHVTDDHVVLETTITGTHTGPWRGLPGTGRRVEFPVCAVFSFDDEGTLAGERIYYDRATVLRQLGMFHAPWTRPGTYAAHASVDNGACYLADRSRKGQVKSWADGLLLRTVQNSPGWFTARKEWVYQI